MTAPRDPVRAVVRMDATEAERAALRCFNRHALAAQRAERARLAELLWRGLR